jgi:hypothetical protein
MRRPGGSFAALALISLAPIGAGCWSKPAPSPVLIAADPSPEPEAPSAAVPLPAPAHGPVYRVTQRFPADTALYDVHGAIVACEAQCVLAKSGDRPKLSIFTAGKLVEDAGLWPGRALNGTSWLGAGIRPAELVYFGDYPSDLYAVLQVSGDRASVPVALAKRSGGAWIAQREPWPHRAEPQPARELDEAIARSPWPDSGAEIAAGAGGPVLLAVQQKLALWDGKAWKVTDAPWTNPGTPARLSSGATLLPATGGVFWIGKDGAIGSIAVEGFDLAQAGWRPSIAVLDGAAWILVERGAHPALIAPKDAAEAIYVPRPTRT